MHHLGPPAQDRLARFAEGVVLVTAAADRPDNPAVGEDEHLGADALRRRSGGRDDRDERRRLAAIEGGRDGGKDFAVHGTIIEGGWADGRDGRDGPDGPERRMGRRRVG